MSADHVAHARPSDEAVRDALRSNGGNVVRTARALEIPHHVLRHLIDSRPGVWPRGVARCAAHRPPSVPDEAVTEALRAAQGHQGRAAKAVGISRQTLNGRVAGRPSIWPKGVDRWPVGSPAGRGSR